MSGNLIRVVQWMSTTSPAPDLCARSEISHAWELEGEASAVVNGLPIEVNDTVRVDREWENPAGQDQAGPLRRCPWLQQRQALHLET